MTSQVATTYADPRRGMQYLSCALLLGLILSHRPTDCVFGEEDPSDPYDVLYHVIMTRYGPDGRAYGVDGSSPAIFNTSDFPFDDETYEKLSAALQAFEALPQEKIEEYSDVKRALMQRHLWHVFDATAPNNWMTIDQVTGKPRQVIGNKSFSARREAVRPKIASLIQRLALTKERILALPDTKAATLESGGFSERHDPGDPFKPFLSAGLDSKEGQWVCIGFKGEPPAPDHSEKLKFRSAFLTFMRLPGGRNETLRYLKVIAGRRGHIEQFPVGTQFAFIEQAFLISDEREMILSPLIISISMRAYLDVERNFSKKRPEPTQSVAEFVAQPRRLMQGNAVMKALSPRDHRLEAGDVGVTGAVVEPFERRDEILTRRRGDMLRTPRLNLCMNCHHRPGVEGVGGGAGLFGVKETSPKEIVAATLTQKRDDYTWNTLTKFWQADRSQFSDQPASSVEGRVYRRRQTDEK